MKKISLGDILSEIKKNQRNLTIIVGLGILSSIGSSLECYFPTNLNNSNYELNKITNEIRQPAYSGMDTNYKLK